MCRGEGKADPVWLKSGLLPSYYADGFHYQTDGWLSARSGEWAVSPCRVHRVTCGCSAGAPCRLPSSCVR